MIINKNKITTKKSFKALFFKSILSLIIIIIIITGQAFFTSVNVQRGLVSEVGTLIFKDANSLLVSNVTKEQGITFSAKNHQTQIIYNF